MIPLACQARLGGFEPHRERQVKMDKLDLIKKKLLVLQEIDKAQYLLDELDLIQKMYVEIMNQSFGQLIVDSFCEDAENFLQTVMH